MVRSFRNNEIGMRGRARKLAGEQAFLRQEGNGSCDPIVADGPGLTSIAGGRILLRVQSFGQGQRRHGAARRYQHAVANQLSSADQDPYQIIHIRFPSRLICCKRILSQQGWESAVVDDRQAKSSKACRTLPGMVAGVSPRFWLISRTMAGGASSFSSASAAAGQSMAPSPGQRCSSLQPWLSWTWTETMRLPRVAMASATPTVIWAWPRSRQTPT